MDEGRRACHRVEDRAVVAEQVTLGSLAGAGQGRRRAALFQSRPCRRGFATRRDGSGGNVRVPAPRPGPPRPPAVACVHFARRALPDRWGAPGSGAGGPKASGPQRAGRLLERLGRGWGDWRVPGAESGPSLPAIRALLAPRRLADSATAGDTPTELEPKGKLGDVTLPESATTRRFGDHGPRPRRRCRAPGGPARAQRGPRPGRRGGAPPRGPRRAGAPANGRRRLPAVPPPESRVRAREPGRSDASGGRVVRALRGAHAAAPRPARPG